MIILATILSGLSLLMSVFLVLHFRASLGWAALFPKLTASALSPIWAIMGAVGAVIGWVYEAYWAIPVGVVGAVMMSWYIWRCTRDHKGFEKAFGADWADQIPPEGARHMLKRRWSPYLKMKGSPEPIWERDIAFWTVPDTERDLLCDIWRPGNGDLSGLALIFFHGGAWCLGDKDYFTRPFFRHLVAQGHTVMDVSYRLFPEVDIYEMIGDVKRAVAWMKVNAARYGVDPDKVVLGGGSAGGHLSMLAGFAPHHPELTPEDVNNTDLSVCGVFSYYGPSDLLAFYHYMNLQILEGRPSVPIGQNLGSTNSSRLGGRLDVLLGGWPQEVPHMYQLASPITHVHHGCPPALLIQGRHDHISSMKSTCTLYTKLVDLGVPAINVVFQCTPHAFDALLPQINPPAQSALYDVDRFLAILLKKE